MIGEIIGKAIGPLSNHLWQSTVFAVVAGLLTIAFRKNRAEVRYWLWLCASLKFLIPFSLLVSFGGYFAWAHTAKTVTAPAVSVAVTEITQPFPEIVLPADAAPHATNWLATAIPFAIFGVWLVGFVVIALIRFKGWLQIRTAVRAGAPLTAGEILRRYAPQNDSRKGFFSQSVRVVSSPGLLEPGVVGFLRPTLLLPEGILEKLTPDQLRAVFAHEMCHVRRRDNLTSALHMIVEAVFWFHPLVWWIGARLVEERERACDEDVLQAGGEAQAYAESILQVCKFYAESPLRCVSGVTGSDLKKRMQRIMAAQFGESLTARKRLLLVAAGAAALAVPIVVGAVAAPYRRAQVMESADQPRFDAVSVKENKAGGPPGGTNLREPGRVTATNVPLLNVIAAAYQLTMAQIYGPIPGAPDWMNSKRFDIEGVAQNNPPADQKRLMLQTLLADRFKLAVHHETRQGPVYALLLSKRGAIGPKLKLHTDDAMCVEPGQTPPPRSPDAPLRPACGNLLVSRGQLAIQGMPTARLAESLSLLLGRTVLDKTGLAGNYDVALEFAMEPPVFGTNENTPDTSGRPSILTAVQEQLGLKLESQTGPVDTFVIDHVEEPSDNATGVLSAPAVHAQSAAKFEVASVKPCKSGDVGFGATGLRAVNIPRWSPGSLTIPCQSANRLIMWAYISYAGGQNDRRFPDSAVWGAMLLASDAKIIEGGPNWIGSRDNQFMIEAKGSGNASAEGMMGPMLQSLLEERFQLKSHWNTREVPVYELTVAKGAPKLGNAEDLNCGGPGPNQPPPRSGLALRCTMNAKSFGMTDLARALRSVVDRPVIDKTGIAGEYPIRLVYASDPASFLGTRGPVTSPDTPSIYTALQEQLGLKLVPAKGPEKFLVIDHIEEPTPN